MIRYALRCHSGHDFESWFRSAEAFDELLATGFVSCPHCASTQVEKALMAPQVRPARQKPRKGAVDCAAESGSVAAVPAQRPLAPATPQEQAAARLRHRLERESEYVGLSFATEARRMHAGDVPQRAIHGEARLDDARALLEEGVPVAPLPFLPGKTN